MSARKPPRLLSSGLTGRVYVVTAYTDHGDGRITARTKHDVTADFEALVAERVAALAEEAIARLGKYRTGLDSTIFVLQEHQLRAVLRERGQTDE